MTFQISLSAPRLRRPSENITCYSQLYLYKSSLCFRHDITCPFAPRVCQGCWPLACGGTWGKECWSSITYNFWHLVEFAEEKRSANKIIFVIFCFIFAQNWPSFSQICWACLSSHVCCQSPKRLVTFFIEENIIWKFFLLWPFCVKACFCTFRTPQIHSCNTYNRYYYHIYCARGVANAKYDVYAGSSCIFYIYIYSVLTRWLIWYMHLAIWVAKAIYIKSSETLQKKSEIDILESFTRIKRIFNSINIATSD